MFMGRLSFCVQAAVDAVGGPQALDPGDVLLYNHPYGTGSHPADAALVMPVFHEGELIGYAAVKGHWLDIGAKDPYMTDSVDMHQEGTIYPGVRLYRRGELVDDIYRLALANSRLPQAVAGDVRAEVVAIRTGAAALSALVSRHGLPTFRACVERIFDHGESVVRSYFEKIPDGSYVGDGVLDDDGLGDELIPFQVTIAVDGSDVTVDFSQTPPQRRGPINCTAPKTVAIARIAIGMLAGAGEAPNEGHYRAISVITRPGTMFHPIPPAPSFIGGWASFQAIEAIYQAFARSRPELVPACSGADICSLVWWGTRERTGEPWADGSPHPVGQGGMAGGDGAPALMHISESATRLTPTEVREAKSPILVSAVELIPDSGGAGAARGGLGVAYTFRSLEDMWATTVVERTRVKPWGLSGGEPGTCNSVAVTTPDGASRTLAKATRVALPKGSELTLRTGGGGGFGPAEQRPADAVLADVRDGYLTESGARAAYPHAFS
jgi:N-methylhydantoinase B